MIASNIDGPGDKGDMADVVAIHGIWAHRSSRQAVHDTWHTALVEGLRNIRSGHADTLTIEPAFYGHEYNDGKPDGEPEYDVHDLEPGLETDLVLAIGEGLADEDDDQNEGKLYLPGALQRALVRIQRSSLFEGSEARLMSFVKQVSRYFDDDELRLLVWKELDSAMEREPALVLAHSLGSVVAYEWLQQHEDHRPALVTVGSPLGLEAIRNRLRRPRDRSRWPGQARSWTNVAARQDAVAMVKELAPLYHPDIVDRPCDNPRLQAHHAVQYLRNVRTARAVDAALS